MGCGGVGRAICFALAKLGVKNLFIIEKDKIKLSKIYRDLKKENINVRILTLNELILNQNEINGFLNCSEVGHYNNPGNPFEKINIRNDQWIFDSVYTPAKTPFVKMAMINNAKIITGIDLFLFQGIETFITFVENKNVRQSIMKKFPEIRDYYLKKLFF